MRTCVRCAAGWIYCALFCFFLLFGGRKGGGGVKICSFAFAFRSTLGFCLSSGTDCRVRRRMHAPFPGPYVSTLALNFNPTFAFTLAFSPDSIACCFPHFLSFSFAFCVGSFCMM